MRKLRRAIKHIKLYYSNRTAIKCAHDLLKEYFGNDIKIKLASMGGEDLNYTLQRDGKIFAIFRQSISSSVDSTHFSTFPIQRQDKKSRFEKEIFAYTHGGKFGLTPKLLYVCDYGVVCEYIHGENLWNQVKKDPQSIWKILTEVIKVYLELHKLGISHLDATLKNCIYDESTKKIKVFDFEYYAMPELNFTTQQAYDIVRIIEHSLRVVPPMYQNDFEFFIDFLKDALPEEVKKADFSLVEGLLQGVKKLPIYGELDKKVFHELIKLQK
jgi:tRNA A-37 threonylcarbamoyl transferase component Bud32